MNCAEAEHRLALLAARLVRERGLAEAQRELAMTAACAEATLDRIAALARGVAYRAAVRRGDQGSRPLAGRRADEEARAVAGDLERQAGDHKAGTVPGAEHNPSAMPIRFGDPALAEELFLLLATLRRDQPAGVPTGEPATSGQHLLALVLPEERTQRRFFGGALQSVVPSRDDHLRRYPLVLILYTLAIVAYLLLRFRGHYIEQDTAEMTQYIEAVANYGSAIPPTSVHPLYSSGFGFQAVNLYLMRLSGADIQTLQSWVWPFLLVGLGLVAFAAFREMTGDDRVAALAGILLFMQPDFLFTALRGSHEKMTYCLLLAALLLLFRSYRYRDRLKVFAGHVALFYLVLFGIIGTNSTFGSSLIAALTCSFFGGALASRLLGQDSGADRRAHMRLAYVSFSASLILFAELFYYYQPSGGIVYQFQTAMDRVARFALSFEVGANPYAYVTLGWRNPVIYLALTVFSWLTLAISGIAWCRLTASFLRGGWLAAADHVRLRWLLYAGLALQVGAGIGVDFAGVLGANLQLRLFPVFMFLAIPTAGVAVIGALDRAAHRRWLRPVLRGGLAVAVVAFTLLSAFKATNEPLLSNKWTFYSTTEAQAMDWLAINEPLGATWADVDERLREVDLFRSPPIEQAASRYATRLSPEQAPMVMLSTISRARLARLDIPLPDLGRMNELYDNGAVQMYRHLPQTPLQH